MKMVKLYPQDARAILLLIRMRQGDIQQVGPEYPTYKVMHETDLALEKLKMKIAKQVV